MPIQLDFILRRLVEMADADPGLRERQPWKAAYERDYAWLGKVMEEHYAGDDTNVRTLAAGILAAYAGISVEDFEAQSDAFLRGAAAPDARPRLPRDAPTRRWSSCSATSRPTGSPTTSPPAAAATSCARSAQDVYGIPRERVIGSAIGARVRRATSTAARSRTSRRPTTSTTARRSRCASGAAPAAGRCSPPATPTATSRCSTSREHADKPSLRLLVLHDDAEREFAYTAGAEQGARARGRATAGRWSASRTTGPRSSRRRRARPRAPRRGGRCRRGWRVPPRPGGPSGRGGPSRGSACPG